MWLVSFLIIVVTPGETTISYFASTDRYHLLNKEHPMGTFLWLPFNKKYYILLLDEEGRFWFALPAFLSILLPKGVYQFLAGFLFYNSSQTWKNSILLFADCSLAEVSLLCHSDLLNKERASWVFETGRYSRDYLFMKIMPYTHIYK